MKRNLVIKIIIILSIVIIMALLIVTCNRGISPSKYNEINIMEIRDYGMHLKNRVIEKNGFDTEYISFSAEEYVADNPDFEGFKSNYRPEEVTASEHNYYFFEAGDGALKLKREEFVAEDGDKELSLYVTDDGEEWINAEYGLSDVKDSRIGGNIMRLWGDVDTGYYQAITGNIEGIYYNLAVRGYSQEEFLELIGQFA